MLIRCWGARGSIPVSGEEYLRYGGDTPCIEIRTKDDEVVIVDAGSGIRKLGNRLLAEDRRDCTLIFTHAHWDHLMGFPFFKPIYQPEAQIRLFGCPLAQSSIKKMIAAIMAPPNFPVSFEEITADIRFLESCPDPFEIGGLKIRSIPISHPNQGMGYRFEEDGKSFVFLTDNELTYRHPGSATYEDYRDFARGADLLVHDAEYLADEYRLTRRWGHSRYTDALQLAIDAGVAQLGLFHHNQERTDRDLEAMLEDCRRIATGRMVSFALHQGMEILL